MEQLNFSVLVAILPTILFLWILVLWFFEKKKNKHLKVQLQGVSITLEVTKEKLKEFQEKQEKDQEFKNSLEVAELTTKLQKPRLDATNGEKTKVSSGKYSSIQSLADQGLTIDEIASTLEISTHEAQQLVNLSKLAQGNLATKVTE